MNKKIVIVFIIVIGLMLLTGCSINQYTSYSHVLKANWNIELPKNANMKEIYSADEGVKFSR